MIEIRNINDIKNINTLDIKAKYTVYVNNRKFNVYFGVNDWTWLATNEFKFGCGSDLSLVLLLEYLFNTY